MTKATVINWKPDTEIDALNRARVDKIIEMIAAGKTEGNFEEVAPHTFKRFFLDQESAQEYIDTMQALAAQYGREILSAIIEEIDVVPFERPEGFVEQVIADTMAIRAALDAKNQTTT